MNSRIQITTAFVLAFGWIGGFPAAAQTTFVPTLTVEANHAVNRFNPYQSLGTTVDRLPAGAAAKTMVQPMLGRILSMGLKPVSYRQNTELHAQAWHWNPNGTWSNEAQKQGYFVGSAKPGKPIINSWGYTLPDRSSNLVDGNLKTYWKSNPYLSEHFTHEPDSTLPQWVIIDFGKLVALDAVKIAWAKPYATHYVVQYWTGGTSSPRFNPEHGIWKAFHSGVITNGHGGTVLLKLTPFPRKARYLRIRMTASSHTCDNHGSQDIRNCLGYAISEIYAGKIGLHGHLIDYVQHGKPGHGSHVTRTHCSSVDSWHKASDLSKADGSQTGFDFFFRSGITSGLPAMVPIAMLYSNPQTSANEIAYLKARHYPVAYVEMGEEPDGQWVYPEEDAALYIQFADAIHKLVPGEKLGGPVFEGHNHDIKTWPDAEGRVSWLNRFITYLKAHGHLMDLSFVSFEHYPFSCDPAWKELYREPYLIQHVLKVYRADGVPKNIPLFVTETNLSAQAGEKFETMFGALWEADYVGAFFDGGGAATYLFHGIPIGFYGHCGPGGGTFGSINVTQKGYKFKGYLSQYFAIRMMTTQWVDPVDKMQEVYHVTSNVTDTKGDTLVNAYALHRPDGLWSLLVINNDKHHSHTVHVVFDRGKARAHFRGKITTVTFGPTQYHWHPNTAGEGGFAKPDGPPVTAKIKVRPNTTFALPAASITVIRGDIRGSDSK